MRILFLDDMKERHDKFAGENIGHDVTHVWTAREAIAALEGQEPFDIVSLDHDLSEEHMLVHVRGENVLDLKGTGLDVARWIALNDDKWPGYVVVHSFNPAGAQNMMVVLNAAGVRCIKAPFGTWWPPKAREEKGLW